MIKRYTMQTPIKNAAKGDVNTITITKDLKKGAPNDKGISSPRRPNNPKIFKHLINK